MSLASLFNSSSIRLHIPTSPIASPPGRDASREAHSAWVASVLASSSSGTGLGNRKLAFYGASPGFLLPVTLWHCTRKADLVPGLPCMPQSDEQLALYLSVRLENAEPGPDGGLNDDQIAFLSHLQVGL